MKMKIKQIKIWWMKLKQYYVGKNLTLPKEEVWPLSSAPER